MSPNSKLMRVLRDPLLHFVLIGAAIFAANAYFSPRNQQANPSNQQAHTNDAIYVGPDELQRLRSIWEERWGTTPSQDDLRTLVDDFVREEILYREALSLGLDEGDIIVRRRLAQKLAFLSQDIAPDGEASAEPTDDDLRAWFESNKNIYRVEPRLTFTQVFFEGTRTVEAEQALAGLRAGTAAEPTQTDPPGPIKPQYGETPLNEIATEFGPPFAEALRTAIIGEWFGPVASRHGVHLVNIRARNDGYTPTFEDVSGAVESDWLAEQTRHVDSKFYDELRSRYNVDLDPEVQSAIGVE